MCLLALALGVHARFPIVVAANRDEFYARPTEPLGWWSPGADAPLVLSGRDLEADGTWMGLTATGRLAMLTNIRAPSQRDPDAESRGRIVTDWLSGSDDPHTFWTHVEKRRHNGFNLIAADVSTGRWFWAANRGIAPLPLEQGVHGLSNAELDTPWQKVVDLKRRLREALGTADSVDALARDLFDALADRSVVADAALPDTGMPKEIERQLSSAFVDMPARGYGTRSSTLLITERSDAGSVTHALERTYAADRSAPPRLRRTTLDAWPPAAGSRRAVAQSLKPVEVVDA
jgi:uncharacterized protein with NRDE domain